MTTPGDNYRERERIKRKRDRWIERLKRIPAIEREFLLDALATIVIHDEPAVAVNQFDMFGGEQSDDDRVAEYRRQHAEWVNQVMQSYERGEPVV